MTVTSSQLRGGESLYEIAGIEVSREENVEKSCTKIKWQIVKQILGLLTQCKDWEYRLYSSRDNVSPLPRPVLTF